MLIIVLRTSPLVREVKGATVITGRHLTGLLSYRRTPGLGTMVPRIGRGWISDQRTW